MWQDIQDIVEVEMMLSGPPGTGITEAEKTQIDTRLATLEGHTLSDFLTGAPADAQVPVYDAGTDTWAPGQQTNGIPRIANSGVEVNTGVGTLDFSGAFDVTVPGDFPSWAVVAPSFGTGAGTFAEGNHTHPLPDTQRYPISSPGSIPTIFGARDLVTRNVGPLTAGATTMVEVTARLHAEGVSDDALAHLYIKIGGTTYSSSSVPSVVPNTFVWGVNAQWTWEAWAQITATTAITFGVDWQSGGGLSVKSGYMLVRRTSDR